jgi:hypothetical protein
VPHTSSQAATKQAVVHMCELAVDAVEQQVSVVGNTPTYAGLTHASAKGVNITTTPEDSTAAAGGGQQGAPGAGSCFNGAKPVAVMGPVSLVDGCVQLLVVAATCGKYTAPTPGAILEQLQALVAATGLHGLLLGVPPSSNTSQLAAIPAAAGRRSSSKLQLMVQLDGDTSTSTTNTATASFGSSRISSSGAPRALLPQDTHVHAPAAGGAVAAGVTSSPTPASTTTSSSVGDAWTSVWLAPPLLQLPPTLADGYGGRQLEVTVGGLPPGRPLRLLVLGWEGGVCLDQRMVALEDVGPSEAGGGAGGGAPGAGSSGRLR